MPHRVVAGASPNNASASVFKLIGVKFLLIAVKVEGPGRHRGHIAAQLRDGWTTSLVDHVRDDNNVGI